MKKLILGIMVFGLVGLICGSARGQTAENMIKLKNSGNRKGCFLARANLEGANLEGANLKGANVSPRHNYVSVRRALAGAHLVVIS